MDADALYIDLSSNVPAYRQIVDALRAMLVVGTIKPGVRLPPVRQLAADLTVHHNTVAEAYRILAAEGWLDLRQGRGAVVVDRAAPKASPADENWMVRRVQELVAQAVARGISAQRITKLVQRTTNSVTN